MITKYQYFLLAHRLKLTSVRWWVIRCYSAPIETKDIKQVPGEFYYDKDLVTWCILENGEAVEISDGIKGQALFGIKEPVSIQANDFAMVTKDIESFYSNLLLNVILLEYPFKGKIEYLNQTFSGGLLDGIIATKLKDKSISIEEYRHYTKSVGFISCLTSIAVPSATYKAVTPPPDIVERRTALLDKYKDQLDDPVIIAAIEKELVDYYKSYMKDDPANGYFLDKKAYAISLKRTEIMFGGEPRLDDSSKLDLSIPSLREGWDMEKLPQMINSLRMGSFNRGASTALGGEAAKFSARVYQNTRMVENDCGSVVGVPFFINSYNKDYFVGRYQVISGKPVEIVKGGLDNMVGRRVIIRSPQTCWVEGGNYCPVCMGREVAESGIGIGVMASGIGNVFLSNFMSLMHGRVLESARYDYNQSIS